MTPERSGGVRRGGSTGVGAAAAEGFRRGERLAAEARRSAAAPRLRLDRRRLDIGREPLVGSAPDEGVERPRRRDGRPAVADHAVGDPGLVARRAGCAGEPFAHGAEIAFRLLDVGHQKARLGGSDGHAANRRRSAARSRRARRPGHAPRAPRGRWSASTSGSPGATRASERARASRSPVESPCRTLKYAAARSGCGVCA